MINIPEYVQPSAFDNQDTESIYTRMKNTELINGQKASDVLDTTPGHFFFNVCRPSAIEKAQLVQYVLNELLKNAFIQYAERDFLDLHGQSVGVTRKGTEKSTVSVTVTGVVGTLIQTGNRFSTPSIGSVSSVEFAATETVVIPEGGSVDVECQAVLGGTIGNVNASTITLMSIPIVGVTGITNTLEASGGIDDESDDDYRQRILLESAKNPGSGSKYDYERWALEVPNVGTALCLPLWDGPGTVKLLIMDSDGEPASSALLATVEDYISGPNGDDGLAPIGAIVTYAAPEPLTLNYAFTVELDASVSIDDIESALAAALAAYYIEANADKVIRISHVAALLIGLPGVIDYSVLTINTASDDIVIDTDEYPVTGTVTGTES